MGHHIQSEPVPPSRLTEIEVPAELDGGPDSWFTSNGLRWGHAYHSFEGAPANGARYRYPNTQQAAPIWFHDHALGVTRLNVYAGLAGGYLLSDPGLAGRIVFDWSVGKDGKVKDAKVALAKQGSGDPFYTAKLHTARFYFSRLLPETAGLIRTARAGVAPLMAMDEALF